MLFFYPSYAHGDKMTAEEKAAKMTAWMKTNFAVSADQLKQVEPLNLEYAQKNYALKGNEGITKEEKTTQMKKNQEEKDGKLKAILTAEQFKTYEAKKMDMKEEMKKSAEGGGGVKNG